MVSVDQPKHAAAILGMLFASLDVFRYMLLLQQITNCKLPCHFLLRPSSKDIYRIKVAWAKPLIIIEIFRMLDPLLRHIVLENLTVVSINHTTETFPRLKEIRQHVAMQLEARNSFESLD